MLVALATTEFQDFGRCPIVWVQLQGFSVEAAMMVATERKVIAGTPE